MVSQKESYICDHNGNRTGVILSLERYEELIRLEQLLKNLSSNFSDQKSNIVRSSKNISSLNHLVHDHSEEVSNTKVQKEVDWDSLEKINGHLYLHFLSKAGMAYGYALGKGRQAGFVVLKGSVASVRCADSLREKVISTRTQLIEEGAIVVHEDCYEFVKDVNFNSSSLAASLIAGNNRSGVEAWHASNEMTIKELGFGL